PWLANEDIKIAFEGEHIPFGDLTFHHKHIHFGFALCEDAWHVADRPGIRLFERKVNLIFNPSASHFAMTKTEARRELIEESSKSFDVYYCYANLLGNEAGRMIFDGEILLAKSGKLIARNRLFSFQDFQVLAFELDDKVGQIAPVEPKEWEFVQASALAL